MSEKKATTIKIRDYTTGEEVFSSIAHGIGIILSIIALILLVMVSLLHGGGIRLASALVFGISLILEYTASTFYHALPQPKAKKVFKVLDHSFIYLLIAGTYTPFCLITLANDGGLIIMGIVWGLAIIGISLEAFWTYRPRWVSTVIYLLLGWVIVIKFPGLMASLTAGGLTLLIVGGIIYSIGCIFYVAKKIKYMHSVWHLFVLGGSICHFFAVILYVI